MSDNTTNKAPVVFDNTERVPSDWTIVATSTGIEAVHRRTGTKFEGTIEEFNKGLGL